MFQATLHKDSKQMSTTGNTRDSRLMKWVDKDKEEGRMNGLESTSWTMIDHGVKMFNSLLRQIPIPILSQTRWAHKAIVVGQCITVQAEDSQRCQQALKMKILKTQSSPHTVLQKNSKAYSKTTYRILANILTQEVQALAVNKHNLIEHLLNTFHRCSNLCLATSQWWFLVESNNQALFKELTRLDSSKWMKMNIATLILMTTILKIQWTPAEGSAIATTKMSRVKANLPTRSTKRKRLPLDFIR